LLGLYLRKNVDRSLDQRIAAVVIKQAARNFFELLVADDFRILRSDFVAHGRWIVRLRWWLWVWDRVSGLRKNVDGGFDQRIAAVVIEQTAGNFFELLVANDFRILDFVAHGRWIVEVEVVVEGLGPCARIKKGR
jgi:hypothetical protein